MQFTVQPYIPAGTFGNTALLTSNLFTLEKDASTFQEPEILVHKEQSKLEE